MSDESIEPVPEPTGKDIIGAGGWATCFICGVVFRRKRETKRSCHKCRHGFCEGEHGSFSKNARWSGTAECILCSTGGNPETELLATWQA